jgi:type I restriction enzyme S subunit
MNKYPKYKSSGVEWIGEIPEHWNLIRLKNEYKIQKGRIPKIVFEDYSEGLVPYLSMDVLRGSETNDFVSSDDGVYVNNGQVLILWDGSNSGEIIKVDKEGILSSTMGVMNKIGDRLNEDFSYYQLKSYEPEIRNNTNGMGIPHVDGSYVRSLSLFVPPHTEQQQIVQFLDEKTDVIDKLISTKERKIELLKQQRTSLINEVITKGLNPKVKMKYSGVEWIGEIPEHWKFIKIGHYTRIVRGGSPRPSGDPKYFNGDFIPWITVGEVTNSVGKYILSTETMLTEEGMKQSRVIEPDTLLLSNSGATLGVPKFTKIKGCINDGSVGFLDIKNEIVHDYLYYFLTTQTELLREQQSGYGQPNLNIDIVSNIKLPLPPINEQEQIVGHLDNLIKEMDDLVSMEQNKIDLLKEYRQSLISEVITGKIDVRNYYN